MRVDRPKLNRIFFYRGDRLPRGFRELKRLSKIVSPPPWPSVKEPAVAIDGPTCEDMGIKVLVRQI